MHRGVPPGHERAGRLHSNMTPTLVFGLAVTVALASSFLCSLCESVLLSVRPAQLEALTKRGARAGRILRRFKREPERPMSALLVLCTAALTIGAVVGGATYSRVFDPSTLWVFAIVFALAVLLFAEVIPKALGVTFAVRLAVPVAHLVRLLVWVLSPALFVVRGVSRLLSGKRPQRPVTSVEEIRRLAAAGRSQGAVGTRVAQFIEGAASLRELTVLEVMVPRGGVAYLSATRSLEENLAVIRSSGHSRFPLTPTADLDDVTGVVLAKELLFQVRDGRGEVDWDELLSPLIVVPETKPLDEVLRWFQEQRKHLAVVVDEYGGTQGVVTLEDVLEEIVGEIEDETDRVEQLIVKRPDGSLLCRGWAETRKVFRVLGVEEKVDYVTIGGFVADLLGRLPKVDDVTVWNGLRFRVIKASARRAERIEVVPSGDVGTPVSSERTGTAQ